MHFRQNGNEIMLLGGKTCLEIFVPYYYICQIGQHISKQVTVYMVVDRDRIMQE